MAISQILSQCTQDIMFYLTTFSVHPALAYSTYIGCLPCFLQALTLMDMSTTSPKATFSVSADLKLIDATGRPFSISIDYAGSLEVGPHDVQYTDRLRALICSPSN